MYTAANNSNIIYLGDITKVFESGYIKLTHKDISIYNWHRIIFQGMRYLASRKLIGTNPSTLLHYLILWCYLGM